MLTAVSYSGKHFKTQIPHSLGTRN